MSEKEKILFLQKQIVKLQERIKQLEKEVVKEREKPIPFLFNDL